MNEIDIVKKKYFSFILSCKKSPGIYSLTPLADTTPFALCFAIFGLHLLKKKSMLAENRKLFDSKVRSNLLHFRKYTLSKSYLQNDKPYLQLLTFSLSALSILGTLNDDPMVDIVSEVIPDSLEDYLIKLGTFKGIPRSGNFAMFSAIFLLHLKKYSSLNVNDSIEKWINLHRSNLNKYGFWSNDNSMTHLQFQNGYHQYEIFDYLKIDDVPWNNAAYNVSKLMDKEGHYAPYIGGGGCYDYDAIFILTNEYILDMDLSSQLLITRNSIIKEQNLDGGFCESHKVRPISFRFLKDSLNHIYKGYKSAKTERLRLFVSLMRPKHNRITTHWSNYSRRWNESNLWDSWFRMLTIARIDIALQSNNFINWGFIDYPGIGYHSGLNSFKSKV